MYGFRNKPWLADYVKQHYVAVAVDAYLLGNGGEFVNKLANGAVNNFIYATASGKPLGSDCLIEDMGGMKRVVEGWKGIAEQERRPKLEKSADVGGGKAAPKPPPGALIIDVYCVYLDRNDKGEITRWSKTVDLHGNGLEPEPDKLWLTEPEWRSLVPSHPRKGDKASVPSRIAKRILCKHATEFIGGSIPEKGLRSGELTLTVEEVSPEGLSLRLEGYGRVGKTHEEFKPLGKELASGGNEDGGEWGYAGGDARLLGFLRYDAKKKVFDRFDFVALGDSWGHNQDMHRQGVGRRWPYGVAFELNTGHAPIDRVYPYTMAAYNITKYFEE